jgi:hypothetical protein
MDVSGIKSAIKRMQSARPSGALVWKNSNGTFSHHRDSGCEWSDENSCRTDLRFTEDHDK